MKFSIRGALLFTTYFALWLGAATTGDPTLLTLAVWISIWSVFLSLPLAIWDSSAERRPFWAGFFAVGLANILIFGYLLMPPSWSTSYAPNVYPVWPPPANAQPILSTGLPVYSNTGSPGAFTPSAFTPVPTAAPPSTTQTTSFGMFYSLIQILAISLPPFIGGMIVYLASRSSSKEN